MATAERTAGAGGPLTLLRSFSFRLGAAFAIIALVGSAATALVVNAAFASRFDRYLVQQQATQLAGISAALSRAYSGNGMWDEQALEAVVPAVGGGTMQVLTPSGEGVWEWDGQSMEWDERWMDDGNGTRTQQQSPATEPPTPSGDQQDGSADHSEDQTPQRPSTPDTSSDQHPDDDSGDWDGMEGGNDPGTQHQSPATGPPAPSGDQQDGGSDHNEDQAPQQPPIPGTSSDQRRDSDSGTDDEWGFARSAGFGIDRAVLAAATAQPTTTPAGTTSELGEVQIVPIVVDGTVVATALVRLPEMTALPETVAFRSEVVQLLLIGGILGALAALALGVLFAGRASRPVREATSAARALAAGDRTVRLRPGRSDEFGEMATAFNSMADAVDAQERLRQGFAAEVAHELRTPLTILRSQVEGMRVGVLEPTPEALTSLDEEVCRISRLVADLQILGSADAAGFALERAATDMGELVEQAVREFADLFAGAEIGLETRVESATAWVDRIRVRQVLANLLSNALKYTPPGRSVRVELRSEPDFAVLRVADSGPGIPADELPHVFDRFFRGPHAQSSGSGIGLTVVRELVEAHGGTVHASSEPGNGTTFTVCLPSHALPSTTGPARRCSTTHA